MKIQQLVDNFTINPNRDIKPNFKLSKIFSLDTSNIRNKCYNCGDIINHRDLKSSEWTEVQYCWNCNHLVVVYIQDRMSGVYEDTVELYSENEN